MEQYATEHRTNEQPSKQYFKQTKLDDIIMQYAYSKKNPKQSDMEKGTSCFSVRDQLEEAEGRSALGPKLILQRWRNAQHLSTLSKAWSIWIPSRGGLRSRLRSIPL